MLKKNSAFSRNIHTPFTQLYKLHIDGKEQKKKEKKKKIFTILLNEEIQENQKDIKNVHFSERSRTLYLLIS